MFKDYRTKRHEVIQIRNADREQRNEAKVKQLEQAEQWQVHVHYGTDIEFPKLYSLGVFKNSYMTSYIYQFLVTAKEINYGMSVV